MREERGAMKVKDDTRGNNKREWNELKQKNNYTASLSKEEEHS
jgi:hypothetical protein